MYAPLGALSAFGQGALEGYDKGLERQVRQWDMQGMEALGRAFQQGPIDLLNQRGPQPPMPGQPSAPAMPPQRMAEGSGIPGAGPPMPSPSGGPAPSPPGSAPAPGGPSPSPSSGAGPSGLPQFDLQTLATRIRSANPDLPPQAMVSALLKATPLLNIEGRQQLAQLRFQMQDDLLKYRREALEAADKRSQRNLERSETPQKMALRQFLSENPNASAAEIQQFISSGRQPRSAPAMAVAKFMQENPDATSDDIKKFASQFAGESAYQRTAGTYGARVETATNEVEQLLPQAIETSRKLPRGQFVPINKLIQSWQSGTSDAAYNDFIMANFGLINAYTRAMNPTGVPRIQERLEQKAIGILSTATSPQAYEVQARRLWKEVQASKKAVAATAEGRTHGDVNAPVPWERGVGKPPVRVQSAEEARKLKPGTHYITPDGKEFIR